ncbi:MAG: acetolactate synthase small subunit, partial [Candidatus Bathyarchaeia archaeon]
SNMFRRRGFNIESISVGPVEDRDLARMTVTVKADSRVLNQIVEQLEKMVEVVKVKRLEPRRTVMREMVLVKLSTSDPLAREEALGHVNSYHGLILDIEPDTLIAEVTGEPEAIDEFIDQVRPIGIEELSRTGVTALEKGRLKL